MKHYPVNLKIKFLTLDKNHLEVWTEIFDVDEIQYDYPIEVYEKIASHYLKFITSVDERYLKEYFTNIYKSFNINNINIVVEYFGGLDYIKEEFEVLKRVHNNFPSGELDESIQLSRYD